jgi:hypothetical protein
VIAATVGQVLAGVLIAGAALVLVLLEVLIAAGISALRHDFEQLELDVRSVLAEVLERDRAEPPQQPRRPVPQPPVAPPTPGRADT